MQPQVSADRQLLGYNGRCPDESGRSVICRLPAVRTTECLGISDSLQQGKQKAQAFQAWASQILGFVAIDRSNAAFAVRVLRNHLNLRRTISHAASSHFVCFEDRLTALRSSIPDYSSAGKCLVLRNYTPRRLIIGCRNGCCALNPAEKPKPATRPKQTSVLGTELGCNAQIASHSTTKANPWRISSAG